MLQIENTKKLEDIRKEVEAHYSRLGEGESSAAQPRDRRPNGKRIPPILIGGIFNATLGAPRSSVRPDWVSMTLKSHDLTKKIDLNWYRTVILRRLPVLLDKKMTVKEDIGRNGYTSGLRFFLGTDAGGIFYGGENQKGSVLFEIKGQLCALLTAENWRWLYRVARFFKIRLTRVDIASDFHQGQLCVRCAHDQWKTHPRTMTSGTGNLPGASWLDSGAKGATLTIGSRTGNKQICIYEKGKQLGDPVSPWARFELRFFRRTIDLSYSLLSVEHWMSYLRGAGEWYNRLFPVGDIKRIIQKQRPAEYEELVLEVCRTANHLRKVYGNFAYWLGELIGAEAFWKLIATDTGTWGKLKKRPELSSLECKELISLLLLNASGNVELEGAKETVWERYDDEGFPVW